MPLRLLALFAVLLAHNLTSAAVVSTPDAIFEIKDDWFILAGKQPEAFTLRSEKRSAEVNVLVQRAPNITEINIERATKELLAATVSNHESAAKRRSITLVETESRISRVNDGWAGEFIGSDNGGRRFRQLILVRPGRIVAVYADSKTLSYEGLLAVVSEIVSGMKNEP